MRRTNFQKRLMSYIRGSKGGHWILENGPEVIRPPGYGEQLTIKRVIYAALWKDLAGGEELRAKCGVTRCVRPEHQSLGPCRSPFPTKPLSLPDMTYSLSGGRRKVEERPLNLVKGVSRGVLTKVKFLLDNGNSLRQVAAAVQLPISEVMKLRNGFYDNAFNKHDKMLSNKRRKKLKVDYAHLDIPAFAQESGLRPHAFPSPTPEPRVRRPEAGEIPNEPDIVEYDPGDVSDSEEVAWLRSIS